MAFSDTVHRLTGFGLAIASDRVIRGTLADGRASAGAADLVIETLASIAPVAPPPPVYRWDGEILTFTAPGVAHYRCRRDRITIAAEHDADPDMVCALLISTALPAVLWLRGDSVLHAAALVSPAGSALAVAGPSGVGKSTVVHQAIQSGATLLADDSIRLAQKGDRVCGSGLAGGYHCGPPGDAARIFHRVVHGPATAGAPLRAVVFLSRAPGPPSLERLDAITGLECLLANQHRPAIPAMIGRTAETLALLGRVARDCEMYEWRRSVPILDAAERALLARTGLDEWVTS